MPVRKRTPYRLIHRLHADQYLLIMLVAFAGAISLTRLGLYLTGYPQLGGGGLHIAHVLWGGLLLFVSALIPLIFANRIIRIWSAILSGVGVGLFIDEVGKFITSTNDYFFPAAAPIIYVFFLLAVLVYLFVRRQRRPNPMEQLYSLIQQLEEIVDGSLTEEERERMIEKVEHLQNRIHGKELLRMCSSILEFLNDRGYQLPDEKESFWGHTLDRFVHFEKKNLHHQISKILLTIGFLILAGWLIIIPTRSILVPLDSAHIQILITDLFGPRLAQSSTGVIGFQGLILLQAVTSFLAFATGLILILRGEKIALRLGFVTLIFSLTIVSLVTFFFDQFSTIFIALFQTILLVALLRYRHRFGNLPKATK
jgi:hypothetical protein